MFNVYGYKIQNRVTKSFKAAGNRWIMSKVGKLWPLSHFKSMITSAAPYHYGDRNKSLLLRLQEMNRSDDYDVVTYELREVQRVPLIDWVKENMKKCSG